jgi:hypothetical protein
MHQTQDTTPSPACTGNESSTHLPRFSTRAVLEAMDECAVTRSQRTQNGTSARLQRRHANLASDATLGLSQGKGLSGPGGSPVKMDTNRIRLSRVLLIMVAVSLLQGCRSSNIALGDIVLATAEVEGGKKSSLLLTNTPEGFEQVRKGGAAKDLAPTVLEMELTDRAFTIPNPSRVRVIEIDAEKAMCRVRVQDGSLRTGWIALKFLRPIPESQRADEEAR